MSKRGRIFATAQDVRELEIAHYLLVDVEDAAPDQVAVIHPYYMNDSEGQLIWEQQCSGALCSHRQQRGRLEILGAETCGLIVIPHVGCCSKRITREEAQEIDQWLAARGWLWRVAQNFLSEDTEAWIWVHLDGAFGILVYPNCD